MTRVCKLNLALISPAYKEDRILCVILLPVFTVFFFSIPNSCDALHMRLCFYIVHIYENAAFLL